SRPLAPSASPIAGFGAYTGTDSYTSLNTLRSASSTNVAFALLTINSGNESGSGSPNTARAADSLSRIDQKGTPGDDSVIASWPVRPMRTAAAPSPKIAPVSRP